MTGIATPIALSFALLDAGFGYKPLEAFAAGAALSSTSLGTTLAALNGVTKSTVLPVSKPSLLDSSHTATPCSTPEDTSPIAHAPPRKQVALQQSRIGTILISAAIIDDIAGLVIASLIPALADASHDNHGNLAWTVVRPILSSVSIAAVAAVVSRFVLRPLFWYRETGERWCAPAREGKPWGYLAFSKEGSGWGTSAHSDAVKLFVMAATLSGMAAIANCKW